MKRISIYKEGILTNRLDFPSQEEAEAGFKFHQSINSFGRNEDWDKETGEVIPAEYTWDISDPVKSQEEINQEAREYLASTDWMIIRSIEQGTSSPSDVVQKRVEARLSIK